jgi:2-polyprenyl-6-methoxyphenol hydroxylase-like FAD-dependent oxidoreductase
LAVAGGSFSGLALALALQKTSDVDVRIFEARSEKETWEVNGSIYLHDGELLLQRLGLQSVWKRLADAPGKSAWVLQQELVSAMTKSLRAGTVQYNSRICAIRVNAEGHLQCDLSHSNGASITSADEDFDLLVAADGLTSTLRAMVPTAVQDRVGLIGDARVQFGREPFLGVHRINFGAGRALEEGLQLAGVLASCSECGMKGKAHSRTTNPPGSSMGRFSVAHWRQTRARTTGIGVGLLLLLLLLLLCSPPRQTD